MRKIILVIILLFSINTVLMSRDYYSGKSEIITDSFTYKVSRYRWLSRIVLHNVRNTLLEDGPYNTEEKRYYQLPTEAILVYPRPEDIYDIILSLDFPRKAEKYSSGIDIVFAIDPFTAEVREVEFRLMTNLNDKVLSIPPQVFEELEKKLVGGNFGIKVPYYMKVATYVLGYYRFEVRK